MALDETSQPVELLLSVSRDGSRTLGAQIEDQLRRAIRDRALRPGAGVPSTRDLARQLGVSRRVVVDAYAQLAAEGYLSLRQGARPRVSDAAAVASEPRAVAAPADAARAVRLPSQRARRLDLPAGGVAALDAPRARDDHRRRAQLRRPPRGRGAALRSGGLPRPRPRRRRRSRADRRHQRLHAGPRLGVPRARGGRRSSGSR